MIEHLPDIIVLWLVGIAFYRLGKRDGMKGAKQIKRRHIISDKPETTKFKLWGVEEDSPTPPPVV